MWHRIAFISFLLLALASLALAQPQTAPPSPQTTASSSGPTTHYSLPPDKLAKATALYQLGGRLRIITTIWSFAVLLGLLYFGIAARLGDWAARLSRFSAVQALIVVPLLLLIIQLCDLPFDAYRQHIRLQYGLSVQSWGSWFGDQGKAFVVAAVLLTFLLGLMLFIIRKSPRRWWFYFWMVAATVAVFLVFVAPYVIDPLFNKFEPLAKTNPQLVTQLEAVTQRGGMPIPGERMFLMKASEKVTTLNAYVTGFGASKRVVVWDNTLQKMTPAETLFVFGHEMGHYVLHHIVIGLVLNCAGLLLALYIAYFISGWMLRRFGTRWRIRALSDWAALPMFFLIFGLLGFVSDPISNSISREIEHQADVYGLEVTHGINPDSQEAGAHAFQVFGEVSLSYPDPSPLVVFWYYDHPAVSDRVRFAHEYDPWSKGEPPKYVK